MYFSKPTLHSPVIITDRHKAAVALRFRELTLGLQFELPMKSRPDAIDIPLTTVSLQTNFDSYIDISFLPAATSKRVRLLVDSGNSTLIVPNWEDIAALPNWKANYEVLGTATEPWGCPANVVKGPIRLATAAGSALQIEGCLFYACTANSPQSGERTANFGAGCILPWSASGWNTPPGLGVTLQAPLSYATGYTCVEFDYEASANVLAGNAAPKIATGSYLTLYKTAPGGFLMMSVVAGIEWMALVAKSLSIGAERTSWPDPAPLPIAIIDTGGGPVFLTDPTNRVSNSQWPDPVQNPEWTIGSTNCHSIDDRISITLGDDASEFNYEIAPASLPVSARGLTLVMCTDNYYMMGNNGMNIGGLSALETRILIDYAGARVGLQAKT
ncbi:hypothetical protein C8D77_12539 [Mesorhizobium loti]|uniref:Uncharacterized protein n=1 Tax=Rhizobium loti TaxID=381 RepID=A0A8E3B1N3_RHILI|nr:hypothetical protein [Mesorhizobium loti]PWJ86046.1 hypothetical protein C8D77_12539 [Mesorhizobium loti]